jgi:hypothetical protein
MTDVKPYDPTVYALAESFVEDAQLLSLTRSQRTALTDRIAQRMHDVIEDEIQDARTEGEDKAEDARSLRGLTDIERARL